MKNQWLKKDLKEAIDTRRIHHQLMPMQVSYEELTDEVKLKYFPSSVFHSRAKFQSILSGLKERGHKLERQDGFGSVIAGVEMGEDGKIYANTDFRKAGEVDGF